MSLLTPKSRRRKRRYKLTPAGFTALRRSALAHQPWTHSTGPRTPEGKATSSQNALKHGLYARDHADAAAFAAHVKRCKRAAIAKPKVPDAPGPPVVD